MDNTSEIINGLWIGSKLSPIEKLCIQSYLQTGHQFILWTYENIENLPIGCVQKDANEIIPQARIFKYKFSNKFGHGKGSYAGFSDIFRYKLLSLYGGWWTDMDITCLKKLNFEEDYIFRANGKDRVVGNLMKCKIGSELMNYCYERATHEVKSDNKNWLLPIDILNDGLIKFDLQHHVKELSNEDSWPLVSEMLTSNFDLPKNWFAIHWMNEEWRRFNLNKYQFVAGSTLDGLMKRYDFNYGTLSKIEAKKLDRTLGVWNYRYINIKARLAWLFSK